MRFLAEDAFRTPTFMIDRNIRMRLTPTGEIDRVQRAQAAVLGNVRRR